MTHSSNGKKNPKLLVVEDLRIRFRANEVVSGISLALNAGETVALVGESGCGKSATALAILRLLDANGSITARSLMFDGQDLLSLPEDAMRRVRGNQISMIFQDPMTSLNPVFTIGDQVGEVFRIHRGASRAEAKTAAIDILHKVKIPTPEKRINDYPHQLSGGMRQRVMIAIALACRPKLLIADEPTTALDVTIQAQILELIREMQQELGMAVLLITHDFGVVSEVCDRVMVMYAGKVVEKASVADLFREPQHPYTVGLLNSVPKLGMHLDMLPTIPGSVPRSGEFPSGCRFHNRCAKVMERCRSKVPHVSQRGTHDVACWLYAEEG